MTSPHEILEEIDSRLPEALTLTVGRLVGDAIEARHLALDVDAADSFREQCYIACEHIRAGSAASYTASAELDAGEYYVIDDDETLDELGEFRRLADNLGAIPQISANELDLTIRLYSVAVGNEFSRILFVRSTNPQLAHKAGKFWAMGQERLTRIDGPVFAFSAGFDFVLGPSWAVVLHQRSFEMLFRQIGLVEQHVSTWIKGITDHLSMSESSISGLRDVALRDSRTWRRLRDIERRRHLADVTLDQVAAYAGEIGLDPGKVVVDGELVFDPAERFGFLHLLNEDLYKGPLTGEAFESQRKSAMS
ncbi:MAG: hypothetical protein F4Y99_07825 [Acidimicrobiaceae bacterium]|nr:hypothetical protein [Acidimicrobiaceae bacterium]MYF42021.1 hypothetical protein [Acidimicrobiaceae bacterium]MYJ35543.1 hypothetical protein [Acidimicrobiaceae bacterium]